VSRAPDPFYQSKEWKALRLAALKRDHFHCTTPGCRAWAKRVDHIVPRRKGGPDTLANLRSLCPNCDNKMMQGSDGERRNAGKVVVTGLDGWPIES
jgi:5-methylcytosine-specific restriction endonuclease McrA